MADLAVSPDEVEALVAQRLNGQPFSATTVPTFDQTVGLIEFVAIEVKAAIVDAGGSPGTLSDDLADLARAAVRLGTAAQLEMTFFPEQQEGLGSVAALLHERYLALLTRLRSIIVNEGGPDAPVFSFPGADPMPSDLIPQLGTSPGYIWP